MQKHRESIYWERSAKEEILETKADDVALVKTYYEQERRLQGHQKNSKPDDPLSSSESRIVKESEQDASANDK